VVGSHPRAVALDYAMPTGRWTATLGLCRLVVRSRDLATPGSPRRAAGRGFVVARFGWSLDDANQPRFGSSFGPVEARMSEFVSLAGKRLQTVTRTAWRGTLSTARRCTCNVSVRWPGQLDQCVGMLTRRLCGASPAERVQGIQYEVHPARSVRPPDLARQGVSHDDHPRRGNAVAE